LFRIIFDSNLQEVAKSLEGSNIDVQRIIQWYINQVYAALYKQHSRNYVYVTPPGSARRNIYKRSGTLLLELKNSKYAQKNSSDEWEAGFKIRPGTYLDLHAGYIDDPPTVIRSAGRSSAFLGRMIIPLRAALNADGAPKRFSARTFNQILILPFKTLQEGTFSGKSKGGKPINNRKLLGQFRRGNLRADFSGEDTSKFHAYSLIVMKVSGRRLIPLYVLAKEVRIRKRIFIQEKMEDYLDALYDRIQLQADKLV
jgi:hypothetical protein